MGGVDPLIFGASGKTSAAFNKLMSAAAEVGSIRHQAELGVNSPKKCRWSVAVAPSSQVGSSY